MKHELIIRKFFNINEFDRMSAIYFDELIPLLNLKLNLYVISEMIRKTGFLADFFPPYTTAAIRPNPGDRRLIIKSVPRYGVMDNNSIFSLCISIIGVEVGNKT